MNKIYGPFLIGDKKYYYQEDGGQMEGEDGTVLTPKNDEMSYTPYGLYNHIPYLSGELINLSGRQLGKTEASQIAQGALKARLLEKRALKSSFSETNNKWKELDCKDGVIKRKLVDIELND